MWRIYNYFFGWDYIHWRNTVSQGVARVFEAECGKVVYWRYKNIRVLDEVEKPDQVIWLTCHSDKYFKN